MFRLNSLPILATVPRSGTWFLRYSISFLSHLERGGRIDDRLTGRTYGDPSGPQFDFRAIKGGPLFRMHGLLSAKHLFIGHTVCPGFTADAAGLDWWTTTPFHVRGYDYFHEGLDYNEVPVDLASYPSAPVQVAALERAARKGTAAPIVLVYRNPIDQARSYMRYCQNHKEAAYNSISGRPLSTVPFGEYLLEHALPSYAKQFISFQVLAARFPDQVLLVSYERLELEPVEALADILDHLAGSSRPWPTLGDAVQLARRDHMKAVEKELGRSLDGTRRDRSSHITQVKTSPTEARIDERTRTEALAILDRMGVNTELFEWPAADKTVSAA
jgi:Sulfotransferase domain